MWPIFPSCSFLYMLNHIVRWINHFENMNFMIYWWEIEYLKNILMFHGECKYPMMMQVLHLNSIILFKWPFTVNVKNFVIPSFTWINMLYWAWNKYLRKYPFVSWFKMLLQYDLNTTLLLSFGMAMQYPYKFQKICYRAQIIYGIP